VLYEEISKLRKAVTSFVTSSLLKPLVRQTPEVFICSLGTALAICIVESLVRSYWILRFWPADLHSNFASLFAIALKAWRFDLKSACTLITLSWPLMLFAKEAHRKLMSVLLVVLTCVLSVCNVFYYDFFKTPFDSQIYGLFEDGTWAVLQTIARTVPLLQILLVFVGVAAFAWWLMPKLTQLMSKIFQRHKNSRRPYWLLILPIWVLAIKGTIAGMALGQQNLNTSPHAFLNHTVGNGSFYLYWALTDRQYDLDLSDEESGLRRLGFSGKADAARVFGLPERDEKALISSLYEPASPSTVYGQKPDVIFFLMESWSAEPFRDLDNGLNVFGALEAVLPQAVHFDHFLSHEISTHPSLEGLLFGTPISPLTQGEIGRKFSLPWSVARIFQQSGYHTVFATSSPSGWRKMDTMLGRQGFDEVIDSETLKAAMPSAQEGIWGVFDEYLFEFLRTRVERKEEKPRFIFVLTTSNHDPYELPSSYLPPDIKLEAWRGAREHLIELKESFKTYRYANHHLGAWVQAALKTPKQRPMLIAATGDHNVRHVFGSYPPSANNAHFKRQVPLMFWGLPKSVCYTPHLPASHRDVFPSIFKLTGTEVPYLRTGRNLFSCDEQEKKQQALNRPFKWPLNLGTALNTVDQVLSVSSSWKLGEPQQSICVHSGQQDCSGRKDKLPLIDQAERAYLGLMDWHIRHQINSLRQSQP
jgi:Sulfatase